MVGIETRTNIAQRRGGRSGRRSPRHTTEQEHWSRIQGREGYTSREWHSGREAGSQSHGSHRDGRAAEGGVRSAAVSTTPSWSGSMFKRYAAFVVVATAITACGSEPTAPRTKTAGAAAFSSGVSSPNTAVGSQFVVYVEGATFYAGDGRPSRNGMGQCRSHS